MRFAVQARWPLIGRLLLLLALIGLSSLVVVLMMKRTAERTPSPVSSGIDVLGSPAAIRITHVNGFPVSDDEQVSVSSALILEGRVVQLEDPKAHFVGFVVQMPSGGARFCGISVHPDEDGYWTAEFSLPESIKGPGAKCTLRAVVGETAFGQAELTEETWRKSTIRYSPRIQLVLGRLPFPDTRRLTIQSIDKEPISVEDEIPVTAVMSIGGRLMSPKPDERIYLGVRPLGEGDAWRVIPQCVDAESSGDWLFAGFSLQSFGLPDWDRLQIVALACVHEPPMTILRYEDLTAISNAVSLPASVHLSLPIEMSGAPGEPSAGPSPAGSLAKVAWDRGRSPRYVLLADCVSLTGVAKGLPSGKDSVWLGRCPKGASIWSFTGPIRPDARGHWVMTCDQWHTQDGEYQIIAAVFPEHSPSPCERTTWQQMASVGSSIGTLRVVRSIPEAWLWILLSVIWPESIPGRMLPVVLAGSFGVSVYVVRRRPWSRLSLAKRSADQLPEVAGEKLADGEGGLGLKLRDNKTVLGVLLLCAGLFAISKYFPFVPGLIMRVLNPAGAPKVDETDAEAIAWMIVVFTAVAGLLLHFAIEELSSRRQSRSTLGDGVAVLAMAAAPSLWVLQGFLQSRNFPRFPVIGWLMGLFVSIVETLVFYFAAKYLFGVGDEEATVNERPDFD